MKLDRRRGARLLGEFWVWLVGREEGPKRRRGNLSISGVYLETGLLCGEPGTVCRLRLGRTVEDFRGGGAVEVLARVVREELSSVPGEEEARGAVGFEYLLESERGRARLEAFVKAAAQAQLLETNDLDVSCSLPAEVVGGGHWLRGATVRRLSTELVVVNTPVELPEGSSLRVNVRSPCSLQEFPFQVITSRCVPLFERGEAAGFEVTGRHAPGRVTPSSEAGASMSQALTLIGEAMVPSESCEPLPMPQLSGVLDQISLFSILGFLEMERRTGVLTLSQQGRFAFVYLRHGQVVDVEAAGAGETPRERLSAVLGWRRGRFDLAFRDVDREDQFKEPTMGLLMDIAREQDESRGATAEPDHLEHLEDIEF